ncbi:winged helix-turn-helix domain-containing protein [Methylomicrobium lacus]|uniref:winged helix-turn-helix domain-containing protein n=1 Tax=Methylomicrobium lacus TaxID=136992 RepID=UPI00045E7CA4|nr:winged helix-turn-helix domain-containing protein [Methylomicrobium lacus]
MQEIRKIMNFYNDQYFLFMLKGYCYSNNIQMTEASFDIDGINEIASFNPELIFIPLDLINATEDMSHEAALLRQACKSREIKICGLNGKSCDTALEETPAWIDMIINNPLDIVEIDSFIKKTVLCGSCFTERRINSERRVFPDRRLDTRFNESRYDESKAIEVRDPAYPHHAAGNMELAEFHIDSRNKSLFLKGHKIDLTPKEFDLIEYLSTDLDRIFTPEEIIKYLWPKNDRATKSDLYQYIHLLRKKIENVHDNQKLILTIKGFGYRLNVSKN